MRTKDLTHEKESAAEYTRDLKRMVYQHPDSVRTADFTTLLIDRSSDQPTSEAFKWHSYDGRDFTWLSIAADNTSRGSEEFAVINLGYTQEMHEPTNDYGRLGKFVVTMVLEDATITDSFISSELDGQYHFEDLAPSYAYSFLHTASAIVTEIYENSLEPAPEN